MLNTRGAGYGLAAALITAGLAGSLATASTASAATPRWTSITTVALPTAKPGQADVQVMIQSPTISATGSYCLCNKQFASGGTVSVIEGNTTLAKAALGKSGKVTLALRTLRKVGVHRLTVTYSGAPGYAAARLSAPTIRITGGK